MLGNSNIYFDKENRVGQQARQKLGSGAGKHRKGLGHAGPGKGSENTFPPGAAPGKNGSGLSMSNPNKLKLGGAKAFGPRNENAPAAGKGASLSLKGGNNGGTGGKPLQRKKLGDISNRGQASSGLGVGVNGSTKIMGGKMRQSAGDGGSKGGSVGKPMKGVSASSNNLKVPPPRAARPVLAERPPGNRIDHGDVPAIELAMGRLGDEEDVLVQRRNEERAAAAGCNPFRTSKPSRNATTSGNRTKRPSSSPSTKSSSSISSHHAKASRIKSVGDISPVQGVGIDGLHRVQGGALGLSSPSWGGAGGHTVHDEHLQKTIDRIIHEDFVEEMLGLKPSGGDEGLDLDANDDVLGDLDWLATDIANLDPSPVSPLDDDSFLTQDLELSLV